MNKKHLQILFFIISISLIVSFYLVNKNSTTTNMPNIIDLVGRNDFWKASLNINVGYDSELIVRPIREDFDIPSEIDIIIIYNNNVLYNTKLEYIPNKNKNLLGKYSAKINSDEFFNENIDNIQLIIKTEYVNHVIHLK